MKHTESYRLMRGAWEAYYEYIPELHTEFEMTLQNIAGFFILIVGCDVVAHVTSAGVLSDTHRDKQRELFMNKGGITRNFVLFSL